VERTVLARRIDGGWLLTTEAGQARAFTAQQGTVRWVHVDGAAFVMERIEAETADRGWQGPSTHALDDDGLDAPMFGMVRAIYVRPGDQVTAGQTLMVLEAMKMELKTTAPFDGTVTEVWVDEGEQVQRGQRLLELEAYATD